MQNSKELQDGNVHGRSVRKNSSSGKRALRDFIESQKIKDSNVELSSNGSTDQRSTDESSKDMNRFQHVAIQYLHARDYEFIQNVNEDIVDFICKDGEVLVFVRVIDAENGFIHDELSKEDRKHFEDIAIKYMKQIPNVEACRIRMDSVQFCVIDDDKTIVRHHINVGEKV